MGLDPRTLGSWPEPKAEALTHWAPQVPQFGTLKVHSTLLKRRSTVNECKYYTVCWKTQFKRMHKPKIEQVLLLSQYTSELSECLQSRHKGIQQKFIEHLLSVPVADSNFTCIIISLIPPNLRWYNQPPSRVEMEAQRLTVNCLRLEWRHGQRWRSNPVSQTTEFMLRLLGCAASQREDGRDACQLGRARCYCE